MGVRVPPCLPNGLKCGVVVQLVRTPACHVGGRGFESRRLRHLSRITHQRLVSPAVFVAPVTRIAEDEINTDLSLRCTTHTLVNCNIAQQPAASNTSETRARNLTESLVRDALALNRSDRAMLYARLGQVWSKHDPQLARNWFVPGGLRKVMQTRATNCFSTFSDWPKLAPITTCSTCFRLQFVTGGSVQVTRPSNEHR